MWDPGHYDNITDTRYPHLTLSIVIIIVLAEIKVTIVAFKSVIPACQVAVGGGVDPGHRALQRRGGRRAGQGDADPHTGANSATCHVCHET